MFFVWVKTINQYIVLRGELNGLTSERAKLSADDDEMQQQDKKVYSKPSFGLTLGLIFHFTHCPCHSVLIQHLIPEQVSIWSKMHQTVSDVVLQQNDINKSLTYLHQQGATVEDVGKLEAELIATKKEAEQLHESTIIPKVVRIEEKKITYRLASNKTVYLTQCRNLSKGPVAVCMMALSQ